MASGATHRSFYFGKILHLCLNPGKTLLNLLALSLLDFVEQGGNQFYIFLLKEWSVGSIFNDNMRKMIVREHISVVILLMFE